MTERKKERDRQKQREGVKSVTVLFHRAIMLDSTDPYQRLD